MICAPALERSLAQVMRAVFDAQPSPALIVDDDARILAFNEASKKLLPEALDPTTTEIKVIGSRFGDALGCIHADGQLRNCGRGQLCQTCVVRTSLAVTMAGKSVVRKRMHLHFLIQEEIIEYYGLITASPFELHNSRYGLLVIEDIGVVAEFLRMIPICSGCGKIRDQENRWVRLETYFKDNWDLDISHSCCPTCLEEQKKVLGLTDPRHTAAVQQVHSDEPKARVSRGQETILLVEDEPPLLDLSKMVLETQGYHVLSAATPTEAIRVAEEYNGEIHLLMTDVIMPEMNGMELAEKFRSLYPDLERLFTSGYTSNVIPHHVMAEEETHFIAKPFSPHELAAKVREVLDHGDGERQIVMDHNE